ncbi:hypothetical protein [Hydrogenophaga sp. BPS33]|uniref:hypothetical protein n=1 Tax=Hydrogenophaga sp. BPS33 TaxID=2651974 RepID=UPI00131FBB07|nr:hypothetical protein [Hydrogenophaga sp. BPS33]QHE87154.1 hypothetical protein F9K07_20745 [Hydrogenophaga sp. BPS33]
MTPNHLKAEHRHLSYGLYVRESSRDPGMYEVTTEGGKVVASEIADMKSAEVFAAAPALMEAVTLALWRLSYWVLMESKSDDDQAHSRCVLDSLVTLGDAARAVDGVSPLD